MSCWGQVWKDGKKYTSFEITSTQLPQKWNCHNRHPHKTCIKEYLRVSLRQYHKEQIHFEILLWSSKCTTSTTKKRIGNHLSKNCDPPPPTKKKRDSFKSSICTGKVFHLQSIIYVQRKDEQIVLVIIVYYNARAHLELSCELTGACMIGNDVWLKLIIRIRLLSLYQWTFTNVCRMNKQETVFPLKCSLTYVAVKWSSMTQACRQTLFYI